MSTAPQQQEQPSSGLCQQSVSGPSRAVENVSRTGWSQRSSAVSVTAALGEDTAQRLRLIRSPFGGGLAPADEEILSVKSPNHSSDVALGISIGEFNAARAKRQKDIAHILPVTEVKRMTRPHWIDIYSLERRYLPIDWYQPKESAILGVKQPNINRDHRHRIVKWMGEACGLFQWSTHTFFTAVHAWDAYMTVTSHEVTTTDLAKLSAACLYFGAQLVESAADENVKPLEEFTELCPEVGSTSALREIQAHLVDTLQGISLVRRTPVDFLLLFLAQMQIASSPCPELFESLLHQNLLDVLWDLVLAVSLTIYANGLVLDGLPGSRWVAGSVLRVLEFSCPALRTDTKTRDILRRQVFHIPAGVLETHQPTIMDPIIKAVWQLIIQAASVNESVETGRQDTIARDATKKSMPYHMIRHHLPSSFPQWPITFPTNRTVQDVSARLRAASFETCTPPNVYATGPSISASKRAGEKSRRHSTTTPGGGTAGEVRMDKTERGDEVAPDETMQVRIEGDGEKWQNKENTSCKESKYNNGKLNPTNKTPYYPVE